MDIEIREARLEDTPIVAWTVLTALDMPTDDIQGFIDMCLIQKVCILGQTQLSQLLMASRLSDCV